MKRCILHKQTTVFYININMLSCQFKSLSPARRQIQKALQGTYTLQGFCHDRRKMTGSGHDAPVRTKEHDAQRPSGESVTRWTGTACSRSGSASASAMCRGTWRPESSGPSSREYRGPCQRLPWSRADRRRGVGGHGPDPCMIIFWRSWIFLFSMMSEIASEMTTDKHVW